MSRHIDGGPDGTKRVRTGPVAEWTPERLAWLATLLTDVNAAIALLPPEERAEYERCQQSVIDARRYAQRHAHEIWVG